jgi:hypothetical protein
MHALARDNAWISRIETPVFVVGTVGAVAALGWLGVSCASRRGVHAAFTAIASCSLAYALTVAARNELRPPALSPPPAVAARYAALRPLRTIDEATIRVAEARGCDRIGIRLEPPRFLRDPWDYPITWEAHRRGMHVRHVWGTEPWPCVLHTLTPPPPGQPEWIWSGEEFTFLRRTRS